MKERYLKIIILIETLLLLSFVIKFEIDHEKDKPVKDSNEGLLSKRIYSGLLPSQSYLATNFNPLREGIEKYLKENDLDVSVYVENLNNGANFGINEDQGTFPASINKIPVAILILQQAEQKKLDLSQKVRTPSGEMSIQELLEKMLRDSDNDAFQTLSQYLELKDLKKIFNYYGLDFYGAYDPSKTGGNQSLLSAQQFSNVFSSLYFSTVLQQQDSEYVLSLLANTSFNLKLEAELPEQVKLAHKYGSYYVGDSKLFHDCGIIYDPELRIAYCIMTRGLQEEKAIKVVSTILNTIYNYTKDLRTYLNVYKQQGHI